MLGEQFGKYKVLSKIGHGAMGEVFKAHDPVLNRYVAIKTISADLTGDDTLRKRFEREAQSAAALNHPNIITVYDLGQEQGKLFMAMELLEGTDLKQVIAQKTLASLDEQLAVMEQIADGLAFAHAAGIVHRDLKPANIHLQPNAQVKIVDFGLARLSNSEMTRTGMVMGTPHYMSPEQVRGERADARSDIFALGCVFYELVTGKKPFEADSMHAVLFKVMQEEPVPASQLVADVPPVLDELVARCLEKDAEQRFQDAGQLRTAVQMARHAIVEGRGDEGLGDVPMSGPIHWADEETGPVEGEQKPADKSAIRGGSSLSRPGSSLRPGTKPGSRPGSSRPRTGSVPVAAPVAEPEKSKAPLFAGIAVVIALVAGGLIFASRGKPGPGPVAPPTTASAETDSLTEEVVKTALEIAQKRLDAGDYRAALPQAERAVRLAPTNAEAKKLYDRIKPIVDKLDAAEATAQKAFAAGDKAKGAEATYALLELDPSSASGRDLTAANEAAFAGRVEGARAKAANAKAAASRATTFPEYRDGEGLMGEAEAARKAGRHGSAVRAYLSAAARFERAQRSRS